MTVSSLSVKPRPMDFLIVLSEQLSIKGELQEALNILCSVIHGFRDTLDVENAIAVQSSLPVFLKGVFQENWKPFGQRRAFRCHSEVTSTFSSEDELNKGVKAVFYMLERHVPGDNMQVIKEALPGELKSILKEEEIGRL